MKSFEKLLKGELLINAKLLLDPLQFRLEGDATELLFYQANKKKKKLVYPFE